MRNFGLAVIAVWSVALVCEIFTLPSTFTTTRFSSPPWQAGFFLVLATILAMIGGFALKSRSRPSRGLYATGCASILCIWATWLNWSTWPDSERQSLVKLWLTKNVLVAYMNLAMPALGLLLLIACIVFLLKQGRGVAQPRTHNLPE